MWSGSCFKRHEETWISMILFSRPLISQFLLPAVSSPQTENTRSTYASDAGADSRFWASGANSGYLLAFVFLSRSCSQQNKQSVQCPQWLTQWPLQQKNVPSSPVPRAGSVSVAAAWLLVDSHIIIRKSDCVPARGHLERARVRARNGCPFAA